MRVLDPSHAPRKAYRGVLEDGVWGTGCRWSLLRFCHIDRQVEVMEVTEKARGALGMNAHHAMAGHHAMP